MNTGASGGVLGRSVEPRQEGEAVGFGGLYGHMNGTAMAGARVVCRWGRVVALVPACQLPDLHVRLLRKTIGDAR